jgi:putative flippase GtrA
MTDTTFPSGGVEAVDVPAVGAPSVVASRHRKPSSWIGRIFRSLCVSGATTILSLAILAVLIRYNLTTPAVANVISVVASIGPSFALNRRLVWKGTSRSPGHWRREVAPFWTYSLLSLVVSTIVVAKAGHWADSIGASPEERTIIIVGAQILTYGMLWMGQFVMLDKMLFRHHHAAHVAALHSTTAAEFAEPRPTQAGHCPAAGSASDW